MVDITMDPEDVAKLRQLIFGKILTFTILNRFMQISFLHRKNMEMVQETVMKMDTINQHRLLNPLGASVSPLAEIKEAGKTDTIEIHILNNPFKIATKEKKDTETSFVEIQFTLKRRMRS